MLEFHRTKSAQLAASMNPSHWGNLTKPLISANSGKFRSMGFLRIAAVESDAANLMHEFGYARQPKGLIVTYLASVYRAVSMRLGDVLVGLGIYAGNMWIKARRVVFILALCAGVGFP
jgi:hypothetical protein